MSIMLCNRLTNRRFHGIIILAVIMIVILGAAGEKGQAEMWAETLGVLEALPAIKPMQAYSWDDMPEDAQRTAFDDHDEIPSTKHD